MQASMKAKRRANKHIPRKTNKYPTNKIQFNELFIANIFPLVFAPGCKKAASSTVSAIDRLAIRPVEAKRLLTEKLSDSIELITFEQSNKCPDKELENILATKRQKTKDLNDRLCHRALMGGLSWYQSRRRASILNNVIEAGAHKCKEGTCIQQQLVIQLWKVDFSDASLQSEQIKNCHDCSEMLLNGPVDGKDPCDFSDEPFPSTKRKRRYGEQTGTTSTKADPLSSMADPHSRWYWNKHRYHICVMEVGDRGVPSYLCGHPYHPALHYGQEAVITCRDIYICRHSGSIHLCSDACEYIVDNPSSNSYCPISKRCGGSMFVDKFWTPNETLSTSTINYEANRRRQPQTETWINRLFLCKTLGEINRHLKEGWTVAQTIPCVYYNFVVSACMWALFCKQITDTQNENITDLYRRRFETFLAQMNTHKTKIETRGVMCVANSIIDIDIIDSKIFKPFVVDQRSYYFILQLANDVVKLWIITKRLRQGKAITDIANFAYAGADVLRTGLSIPSRGADGVIFPESLRYKLILPPFSSMMAICSNQGDVNTCRQQIVDTITHAVERDGVPATSINLMEIDLHSINKSEFVPLKPYNIPSLIKM